jgi:hypothetical protein
VPDEDARKIQINVDEMAPRVREATDLVLRSLVADYSVLYPEFSRSATAILEGLDLDNVPLDDLNELTSRIAQMWLAWWFVGKVASAEAGLHEVDLSIQVGEAVDRWAAEVGPHRAGEDE